MTPSGIEPATFRFVAQHLNYYTQFNLKALLIVIKHTDRKRRPIYICLHLAQRLRCCATNLKVAGSIPEGVIRIFHCHNPSDRAMTLGSTQPLTEMSSRRFSGGKCGRCVRLTTLPSFCAVVMKSGNLNFLETSGPLQACNGTALPFTFALYKGKHKLARHTVIIVH